MSSQPIIPGFFPDPSICYDGERYLIVNSSFEFLPGLPLHESTDLVSWTPIGNALTRPSQIAPHAGAGNTGVYAPTIRAHDGRYWIIGTNMLELGEGRGHFLLTADDPAGPWSDPVHMNGVIGIDPDITWDERGVCRVTWASVHPEHPGIVSAPIDPSTGDLLEGPTALWQGSGGAHPEGPHLYRVGGWWYLLLAEGGTERGHSATIARARSLEGPWEQSPHTPLLTHRGTADPVQNVGHADLIELSDGSWAVVHLGVRPRGKTPGFHVNGRETFLAGIDWIDGWPVADESRFEPIVQDHSFHDDFSSDRLHLRWLGAGAFPDSFATPLAEGGVRLDASAAEPGKALFAARARDENWTTVVELGAVDGETRVVVRMDETHWYGLVIEGGAVSAVLAIGPAVHTVERVELAGRESVILRISSVPGPSGPWFGPDEPDLIELAVRVGDEEHVFGSFDGRYVSTEVAGGFIGRLVGVEVPSGTAVVKSIRYSSTGNNG